MTHTSIENLIRREACKSNVKHKLGCVIIKGSSILSVGHNQRRYSTLISSHPNLHPLSLCAEKHSLLKLRGKGTAKGARLYVGRVNSKGEFLLAKPCKTCRKMIEDMGIKKVYYTTSEGIFREM
jgi:deoxycytidylate deaminase